MTDRAKKHAKILQDAGFSTLMDCNKVPKDGGPPVTELRKLAKQLGVAPPLPRSRAALCDVLRATSVATKSELASGRHAPAAQLDIKGLPLSKKRPAATHIRANCVDIVDNLDLPDPTDFRLALYKVLQQGKLKYENCEYTKNFKELKLLPKNSASTSWISLGEMKVPSTVAHGNIKSGISIKLAFVSKNPAIDNSLEVERLLYRDVANSLIINGYTPHVTVYYGTLECNKFMDKLEKLAKTNTNAAQMLSNMEGDKKEWLQLRKEYNLDQMRALVTEKSQGVSLSDFVIAAAQRAKNDRKKQKQEFETVLKPIFFQILYTLAVFEDVGLQHNDLHDGNVFVDMADFPIDDQYFVDDQCYQPTSRYMTRIYDFDRAYKGKTQYSNCEINNTALENNFCALQGQCEQLNPRADLFRLLGFVYITNVATGYENAFLTEFLEFIAPRDLLNLPVYFAKDITAAQKKNWKKAVAWHGTVCYCAQPDCEKCTVRLDKRIKSARQALKSRYFDDYREEECKEKSFVWQTPADTRRQQAK